MQFSLTTRNLYMHTSSCYVLFKQAVHYVLSHPEERTWAVINLEHTELDSIDYTLRLNYTTVPNTNIITDFLSVGLDTHYQRYYLSGFLTLQQTIDAFLFNRTVSMSNAATASPAAAAALADTYMCKPPQVSCFVGLHEAR